MFVRLRASTCISLSLMLGEVLSEMCTKSNFVPLLHVFVRKHIYVCVCVL